MIRRPPYVSFFWLPKTKIQISLFSIHVFCCVHLLENPVWLSCLVCSVHFEKSLVQSIYQVVRSCQAVGWRRTSEWLIAVWGALREGSAAKTDPSVAEAVFVHVTQSSTWPCVKSNAFTAVTQRTRSWGLFTTSVSKEHFFLKREVNIFLLTNI